MSATRRSSTSDWMTSRSAADFDLDAMIRDTLRRSREADPHVIAQRLAKRIPEAHLRDVVARCLADRVRVAIHHERMDASSANSDSPRVGQSRWQRPEVKTWLHQRVCINGQWKLLGDMTADDCAAKAEEYDALAAKNAAKAAQFRDLASRVRAAGVTRVRDISDDDLAVAA